jgi:hypothetical protein
VAPEVERIDLDRVRSDAELVEQVPDLVAGESREVVREVLGVSGRASGWIGGGPRATLVRSSVERVR